MSSSQVAAHLGVSDRRVRGLIDSGQIPAHQIAGRWVVPADAALGFSPKSAGRPMAEHSAWSVMARLAGEDIRISWRLRNQLVHLGDGPAPHLRLSAWMAARGQLFRAWAFRPVIDDLSADDRLILSGEHGAKNLAPSDHLHAYVAAVDLDHVVDDHNLRPVSGGRVPNVLLWAVADPDAIPRRPDNPHIAADVVAALDLLDDGDPRAVGEASDIIAGKLRSVEAR